MAHDRELARLELRAKSATEQRQKNSVENLTLTRSSLKTTVKAKGADKAKVEEAAAAANGGCPISKVLKLDVGLELNVEV